jgi:hypothetical protein
MKRHRCLFLIGSILVVSLMVACGGRQSSAPQEEAAPAESGTTQAELQPQPQPQPESEPPATSERAEPPPPQHRPAPSAPRADRTETKPTPAAEPAPPPPEPIVKTIPAGTTIEIVFLDGVSSAASQVGDSFRARVARDVSIDGITVVPAGSTVGGTVTEAVSLKKIGGRAKLTLDFARLELPSGRTALIHASLAQLGKSETKKDAATIGGAAAGGALLGRILSKGDKDKGTVIGAIAGAAAGTAIAAKTAGQEIEIPAGTPSSLTLDQPTEVTVQL